MTPFLSENGPKSAADFPTLRLHPAHPKNGVAAAEPLEAAARAYHDLRRADPKPEEAGLDSWALSYGGRPENAHLFRSLHASDPQAADRLARAVIGMPQTGTEFVGFHLLSELGRGAFGRVFLARQNSLAERHVVLKIAADIRGESQALAQLQHPNIVPIYSVHRHDPFQVVCMPFYGATTLREVLYAVQSQAAMPTSGNALCHALGKLGYVEAVVCLGSGLADGLAHAHEHGIIHRDIKPANVLLADDGRAMLLDFNIATDTKSGGGMIDWAAGTLPYMAPEQLAVITREQDAPTSTPVDARCDIYALGIVLFELLCGHYPFVRPEDRRAAPPRLRCWNRAVSPALEAIVRRCLEPNPECRYAGARELHEDLERQRTHRPLAHTPEPSRVERAGKLMRRHPRLAAAGLVTVCAAIVLAVLAGVAGARQRQLQELRNKEDVRLRKEEERTQAIATFQRFREDRKTCQFLLYTRTPEPDQLADGITQGLRLLGQYGVLEDAGWRTAGAVQRLPIENQEELAEGVGELAFLLGRAGLLQAANRPGRLDQKTLEQIALLNERAAQSSRPMAISTALCRQCAQTALAAGRPDQAKELQTKADALPLRTAADHYWLASEHISSGRLREALPLLHKAASLEPQNFWAWFVLAHCHERLGADGRAEGAYAACIALWPRFHWAYFNRGLAYLRQKDYRLAIADFDKVIELTPALTDTYVNRALARQGLQQYREAEQDLTEALRRGDPATRLYFLRSRVRTQRGDKEGARRDYEHGLSRAPVDEKSWLARGFAHLSRDPKAALADFEQALRLNPRSAAGLQNKAHVLAEKLGRNSEALEVLDAALDFYPDSVPARSGRGVVLARLGRREAALKDAGEILLRDSSAARLYQAACVYALTSSQESEDHRRALELLSSALRQGYGHDLLDSDRDLDPLRNRPEFRRLVEGSRSLRTVRTPAQTSVPK